MLKSGLSIAHFRRYIPMIEKEASDYFMRWGDCGQRGKYNLDERLQRVKPLRYASANLIRGELSFYWSSVLL